MSSDSDTSDSTHQAWVALGSNIQPEIFLPWAVHELAGCGTVIRVARVWQSAPVGDTNQADFCNSAALLQTALEPLELKRRLRGIEERLGRRRDPLNKNAPRTIDLDLSLYDDLILQAEELAIPDADLFTRDFLAIPMAELTPTYRHPQTDQTLQEIADSFAGSPLQARSDILLPGAGPENSARSGNFG